MNSTVLLVDDSASMVAQLSESIQFHAPEFVVLGASNGQKAIEVLESRRVDVLVTDLAMPVMDGFELLGYVKRRKPNLPFIVLSSMPYDRAGWRLAPFGAPPFLAKPVDPETLIEKMRDLLREVSAGRIVGVTLPNLLQLLEWERKSCSVRITSEDEDGETHWGRLHFLSGQLVNAYAADDGSEGEAAARRILGWEASDLELERSYHNHERVIERPLQQLLLDSAREADEEEARRTGEWPAPKLDAVPPAAPSKPAAVAAPPAAEPVSRPHPATGAAKPTAPKPAAPTPAAPTAAPSNSATPKPPVANAASEATPATRAPSEVASSPTTSVAPAPAPPPTAALEHRIDALTEALETALRALTEARAELDGVRAEQRRLAAASAPEASDA